MFNRLTGEYHLITTDSPDEQDCSTVVGKALQQSQPGVAGGRDVVVACNIWMLRPARSRNSALIRSSTLFRQLP